MSQFIDKEAVCDDDASADEKSEAPNSQDEKFIDDETIIPETPSIYAQVNNDVRTFSPPIRPASAPHDMVSHAQTPINALINLATPVPLINQVEHPVQDNSHVPAIELSPINPDAKEADDSIMKPDYFNNHSTPLSILNNINQFNDSDNPPEEHLDKDDIQPNAQCK